MRNARLIGLDEGLRYVYEGNVPGEGGENSYCPSCGEMLIKRYGYLVEKNLVAEGNCPGCGISIDGIWK